MVGNTEKNKRARELEMLKEAMEDDNWDLVREVIAYLRDDDIFEQYKEDEDWWKGADEDN